VGRGDPAADTRLPPTSRSCVILRRPRFARASADWAAIRSRTNPPRLPDLIFSPPRYETGRVQALGVLGKGEISTLLARSRLLSQLGLSHLSPLHLRCLSLHLSALSSGLEVLGLARLSGLSHLSARRLKLRCLNKLGTHALGRHELHRHRVHLLSAVGLWHPLRMGVPRPEFHVSGNLFGAEGGIRTRSPSVNKRQSSNMERQVPLPFPEGAPAVPGSARGKLQWSGLLAALAQCDWAHRYASAFWPQLSSSLGLR